MLTSTSLFNTNLLNIITSSTEFKENLQFPKINITFLRQYCILYLKNTYTIWHEGELQKLEHE